MRGQRREGVIEPIPGEEREAAWSQELSQRVDEPMSHDLGSGAELERRNYFRQGIKSHPQPEHLCGTPKPGAQFVQLQVREMQVAEGSFVQALRMFACTREPTGNRGLPKAEDAFSRGGIQRLGQCRQHTCDLLGRRFQPVQRRVPSSTEGRAAGLTAKGLAKLGLAVLAITNERMDVCVCLAGVGALLVGAGEARGRDALGGSSPTFDLTPGLKSRRRWHHTRRGRGSETTGWAIVWGARLELVLSPAVPGSCQLGKLMMGPAQDTQPRQREQQDTQKQQKEHKMRHTDPHDVKWDGWEV